MCVEQGNLLEKSPRRPDEGDAAPIAEVCRHVCLCLLSLSLSLSLSMHPMPRWVGMCVCVYSLSLALALSLVAPDAEVCGHVRLFVLCLSRCLPLFPSFSHCTRCRGVWACASVCDLSLSHTHIRRNKDTHSSIPTHNTIHTNTHTHRHTQRNTTLYFFFI